MFTTMTARLLAALMLAAQLTGACATTAPSASANVNVYTVDVIYCVDEVYTSDGNRWSYDMVDTIDGIPTYDGMPVTVWLSDNGTPNCVTDDVILALSPASSNI